MVAVRRLAVLALLGALSAAFAGAADAARPAGSYPETITTPHFSIHFTGAPKLSLTSLSSQGVKGATVTRKLTVVPAKPARG